MDRKKFIKTCGAACLSMAGISFIESCKPTKQVRGRMSDNKIVIEKKEFEIIKTDKKSFRKSLITKSEHSEFPIIIYRFSETEYSALLLRCTHQNSELNLNGDIMTCSAHGSEFNNQGEVLKGPAEQRLQAFKVTSDEANIFIHLS